ncbi:MAG: histidinol-phosphatase HisJ family protein [Clostridia bacterium]|nr:histidinol-phosphatase HisJ family protein [Clostridia bacterium]
MQKFLTDIHNHSTYSFDGVSPLAEMLKTAQEKGVAFYGVSEHFDFDEGKVGGGTNAEEYFHGARHLQEDYAGAMNVLVGAEIGFSPLPEFIEQNRALIEKYRPDFVVSSVHACNGEDYHKQTPFYQTTCEGVQILRPKKEAYREYLSLVRRGLDAPYSYDIIGHFGYPTRYAPYADKTLSLAEFGEEIDGILKAIIQKNKILEVNASNRSSKTFSPCASEEIVRRYFALGGRQVSYASDAHTTESILRRREETVEMLKNIGFTYITVPCRGEYIKVEI